MACVKNPNWVGVGGVHFDSFLDKQKGTLTKEKNLKSLRG
jgi:hypothetical protein